MRSLLRYAPHAFVALGLLGGVPSVASAASRTPVPVRGALADRSHLRGLVPGTQTINLVFHLRPRNHELLDRLANRSGSRPALSAQRVHDLFAPRRHTRAALIEYLEAHGLNAGGGQNGFAVLARGSNAAAESALAVSIGSYQSPKGTVFRAPVTEPKLPTRLATGVTSISGLDTSNRAEPRVVAQPNAVDPQLGCTGPGAMHGTQGALLTLTVGGRGRLQLPAAVGSERRRLRREDRLCRVRTTTIPTSRPIKLASARTLRSPIIKYSEAH